MFVQDSDLTDTFAERQIDHNININTMMPYRIDFICTENLLAVLIQIPPSHVSSSMSVFLSMLVCAVSCL